MAPQFRLRSLAFAIAVIAVLLGGLAAWRRAHPAGPGLTDDDLIMTGVRSFDAPPFR
jgi:predicted small integral membrane protein